MAEHNERVFDLITVFVFIFLLIGLNDLKAEGLQTQYLGCFFDNPNSTSSQSPAAKYYNETTIENCITLCGQTTYAVFKNGMNCECRNDYGSQVPDRFCNAECAGNRSSLCGWEGHYYIPLVYALYAVCPVGTYGSGCENACHCDQQVPCDRWTGACPAGCQQNFSGKSCASSSLSHQYIGCYKDGGYYNRSMGERYYQSPVEACVNYCATLQSTYAGPQYGAECFCADSYDKHGPCEKSNCKCDSRCYGNSSQICGGAFAISVYSVCPAGYYGKNCRQMCNCASGECNFRNGSCGNSTCKSGWTGQRCDIRDCETGNGDCNSDETCEVVDLNYANVSVCRCREGFRKINLSDNCTDVDECSEASLADVCGQYAINCTNTFGSYECNCNYSSYDGNGRCTQVTQDERGSTDYRKVIIGVVTVCLALIAVIVGSFLFRLRSTRGVSENNGVSRKPETTENLQNLSEMTYMSLGKRTDNDRLYEDLRVQGQSDNSKVGRKTSASGDSKTAELTNVYMVLDRRNDKDQVYDDLRLKDYRPTRVK